MGGGCSRAQQEPRRAPAPSDWSLSRPDSVMRAAKIGQAYSRARSDEQQYVKYMGHSVTGGDQLRNPRQSKSQARQ